MFTGSSESGKSWVFRSLLIEILCMVKVFEANLTNFCKCWVLGLSVSLCVWVGVQYPFGLISFGKHFRCWTENQSFFRQKSIKRKPEPSKLANQQLNRLWRTIGRMLVCWKEGLLVDTSWFSRGDVMRDAHQKLPSEAHLEHSALEVGDYCSLPPGDDESRALGLCVSFKKTRRLFGVVIAAVWDKFPAQVSMWARDIQGAKNHSTCSVQFCFFSLQINVCDFLFMFISSKISSTEK